MDVQFVSKTCLVWAVILFLNGVYTTHAATTCQSTAPGQDQYQTPGSCDFSHGLCNYTIHGYWLRTSSGLRGFSTGSLSGGHVKGNINEPYYLAFGDTLPNEKHERMYTVVSPSLPPGDYCLQFWYIWSKTGGPPLNVMVKTHGQTHTIWNNASSVAVGHWTPVNLEVSSKDTFQIIWDTNTKVWPYLGLDDILLSKRIMTTPTTLITTTYTPTTTTPTTTTPTTTTPTTTTPTTTTPTTTTPTTTAPTTTTSTTTTSTTTTPTTTTPTTTTPTTTTSTTTTSTTTTSTTTTSTTTKATTTTKLTTTTPTTTTRPSKTARVTPTIKMDLSIAHTALQLEDAIHASCSTSSWHIVVDLDLLRHLYPQATARNVFLGASTCLGTANGSQLVFSQGLQDCQTSKQILKDVSIYKNELVYAIFDPINPFIIRQQKWSLTVKCDVARNVSTSSHVHHHVDSHEIELTAQYSISLSYYSDPQFQHILEGNEIRLGDNVYVKVDTHAGAGVKMRVHTCYTKPSDDASDQMKYYIIKNGCVVDSHTSIISRAELETRFVFQDFEYASDREGLSVFCNAVFCETDDQSTRCQQSCQFQAAIIG